MTDDRTTELMKLLDERGEHYVHDGNCVTWSYYSDPHTATESMDGTLIVTGLTPEQAIAATLGSGTLTAEQVQETVEKHWHDLSDEYDMPEATALPEYSYDWQTITDELNSRAERTCKPLGTIRYDYEGGYAGFEYETELSCGHKWRDAYGDFPDYCPSCGCKVVGE